MMNPNARTENVTICMTVREKQFFRKKADEQGITLTEYIRRKLYGELGTKRYKTTRGIECTCPIESEDNNNV